MERYTSDPFCALFIKNPNWKKGFEEEQSEKMAVNSADDPGVALFLKNPYWKKFYDEAPSERVKEYLQGVFEYSGALFEHRTPSDAPRKGVFCELTIDDLVYLMKDTTGMERLFYQKRIQALRNHEK